MLGAIYGGLIGLGISLSIIGFGLGNDTMIGASPYVVGSAIFPFGAWVWEKRGVVR